MNCMPIFVVKLPPLERFPSKSAPYEEELGVTKFIGVVGEKHPSLALVLADHGEEAQAPCLHRRLDLGGEPVPLAVQMRVDPRP